MLTIARSTYGSLIPRGLRRIRVMLSLKMNEVDIIQWTGRRDQSPGERRILTVRVKSIVSPVLLTSIILHRSITSTTYTFRLLHTRLHSSHNREFAQSQYRHLHTSNIATLSGIGVGRLFCLFTVWEQSRGERLNQEGNLLVKENVPLFTIKSYRDCYFCLKKQQFLREE
ncbi:hypothetical protein BGX38DRAFT_1178290 [Terfezia claveryi]|nr:hypothetical protein BGX38DRAFT_1178290 [Terfezia claveryi]